jgi:hypothetical protein
MTYEQLCDLGEALEQDERCVRAEEQIHDLLAAEAQRCGAGIGALIGYRCETEGCSGNPARPSSLCNNCRAVLAVETLLTPRHPMQNPWTTSDGRYFASASDAALQQRWIDGRRNRYVARVRRHLAQRLADRAAERVEVTPDTYREALALLGDAWDRRAFCRFRRVLEYVANVDIDRGENELARWFAGIRDWRAAAPRDVVPVVPQSIQGRADRARLIHAA